ncbi:hypothetical protein [Myxosarcina sp. GI1]|uniref:hypothetical protein n=1 Tax=Myxosarcina sp. GI1 TaxID=1541065 RepID=UPI000565E31C|nr:hypothetical protein [Myxosarcina sp. GI1]
MKIECLIGISGATLVVYRVNECFSYAIAFWDGWVCQPQEIYYTAKEARDVGVSQIELVIGYR